MKMQEHNAQPITPADCVESEKQNVPPETIIAINGLLAARGRQKQYMFEYNQVVEAITAQGIDRRQVYSGNYLRFQALYEDFGWNVVYKDLIPDNRDDAHMVYIFTPKPPAAETSA